MNVPDPRPGAAAPAVSARALRTRAALLAAGLELLSERPVDAVSIDELVAAAGVGKGSFFNHFTDKPGFVRALSQDIRIEVKALVGRVNAGEPDALARLAGGMVAGAAFALTAPKRTAVLAQTGRGMTLAGHPLNQGVRGDLDAAREAGQIGAAASRVGVLFWVGCCQAVMGSMLDAPEQAPAARLADMLLMGLAGLGAAPDAVARLADPVRVAARLEAARRLA